MKTGERQERWQRIRLEQIEEDMKREEEIDGIGEHRHRRPCFLHVGVEEEGLGAPPPVRLHGGGVLAAKAHVLPRVHLQLPSRGGRRRRGGGAGAIAARSGHVEIYMFRADAEVSLFSMSMRAALEAPLNFTWNHLVELLLHCRRGLGDTLRSMRGTRSARGRRKETVKQ
jgi:hypothetical protein